MDRAFVEFVCFQNATAVRRQLLLPAYPIAPLPLDGMGRGLHLPATYTACDAHAHTRSP